MKSDVITHMNETIYNSLLGMSVVDALKALDDSIERLVDIRESILDYSVVSYPWCRIDVDKIKTRRIKNVSS